MKILCHANPLGADMHDLECALINSVKRINRNNVRLLVEDLLDHFEFNPSEQSAKSFVVSHMEDIIDIMNDWDSITSEDVQKAADNYKSEYGTYPF